MGHGGAVDRADRARREAGLLQGLAGVVQGLAHEIVGHGHVLGPLGDHDGHRGPLVHLGPRGGAHADHVLVRHAVTVLRGERGVQPRVPQGVLRRGAVHPRDLGDAHLRDLFDLLVLPPPHAQHGSADQQREHEQQHHGHHPQGPATAPFVPRGGGRGGGDGRWVVGRGVVIEPAVLCGDGGLGVFAASRGGHGGGRGTGAHCGQGLGVRVGSVGDVDGLGRPEVAGQLPAEFPQRPAHLPGVHEPVPGVLGQGALHEPVHGGRQLRVQRRRRGRCVPHVLRGDRHGGFPHERRAPGQQLEKHARGGVQVRTGIHRGPAGLFGGKVLCGAEHRLGLGQRGLRVLHGTRDPEVHDLNAAVRGDLDVGGFDVPVHDPRAVAEGQGVHDAEHVLDGLFRSDPRPVHEFPQCAPGDVFHDDVGAQDTVRALGADFPGVVDGHDRVVVEGRHGVGLALEPLVERLVRGQFRTQDLDGHAAAQAHVLSHVHRGHATAADDLTDLVPVVDQIRQSRRPHACQPPAPLPGALGAASAPSPVPCTGLDCPDPASVRAL